MAEYRLITFCLTDVFLGVSMALFLKRRFSWKITIAALVFMELELWLFEYVCYVNGMGENCYDNILLGRIPVVAVGFFLSEYWDARGLFTALSGVFYGNLGGLVVRAIYCLNQSLLLGIASSVILNVLLLVILYRDFRPAYWKAQEVYRKEWVLFSLILIMFITGNYLILGAARGLPIECVRNVIPLLYLLNVFGMIVMAFRVLDRLDREQSREQAVRVLEASGQILKQETEEIQRVERRITQFNLDNRQFVAKAEDLMAAGCYEQMEELLEQMQELPARLSVKRYCQNLPISGVISYYVRMARKNWIHVIVQAEIPENIGEYEWEIAVMLGNLLDNAVRACTQVEKWGNRKMTIKVQQIRRQIIFEIRNTYAGKIQFDSETGLPLSQRGEGHGLGMGSVASCVEKWGGILDCGEENGWFFVRILI